MSHVDQPVQMPRKIGSYSIMHGVSRAPLDPGERWYDGADALSFQRAMDLMSSSGPRVEAREEALLPCQVASERSHDGPPDL